MTDKEGYEFGSKFQRLILALIIKDNSILPNIKSVIKPEYFSDPIDEIIANYILQFWKQYNFQPTKDEFIEYISETGNSEVLKRINKVYKTKIKNIDYIQEQIINFAQFKSMKEAILKSSDLVGTYNNHLQIKRLISDALKVGMDLRDIGTNIMLNRKARFAERLLKGINSHKISTGLKELDKRMGGGLDVGELGVILAPPKGFKTGTLVNLGAAAMIHRNKVIHYTLEVSELKTEMRYERRLAGLNKHEIINDYKKLDKMLKHISKIGGGLVVKGFPMGTKSVTEINNHIEYIASEEFIPDMVIIDYGDLLRPDQSEEKRNQLARIYVELRAIAQERNIPIWTASQANRKAVSKKIIRKEDIAESFEKVAIADIVIAICQTPEERKVNKGRYFIAANREGEEGGVVYTHIDYDKMRIREINLEEETYE